MYFEQIFLTSFTHKFQIIQLTISLKTSNIQVCKTHNLVNSWHFQIQHFQSRTSSLSCHLLIYSWHFLYPTVCNHTSNPLSPCTSESVLKKFLIVSPLQHSLMIFIYILNIYSLLNVSDYPQNFTTLSSTNTHKT